MYIMDYGSHSIWVSSTQKPQEKDNRDAGKRMFSSLGINIHQLSRVWLTMSEKSKENVSYL